MRRNILVFATWVVLHFALQWKYTFVEAADLLQNGDFEKPPANTNVNETNQRALLSSSNAIPGWKFGGAVEYIKAGQNMSLRDNGHAIQLGHDGSISQGFTSRPESLYILTFDIADGEDNCSNPSSLSVSVPPHSGVFYLQQSYGSETWETHAWGFRANGGQTNITFRSQPQEIDTDITCGPVVDAVFLKELEELQNDPDNILLNGDFEQGLYLVPNSTMGVLLQPGIDMATSSLPGWTIIHTVKYIDFNPFNFPEGNAAIEIVSGPKGGIQQTVTLAKGVPYTLKFELGNANDSCLGTLTVGVQAGLTAKNFTYMSDGTGDSMDLSMEFITSAQVTNISFFSLSIAQTKELAFCGPLIDNVILVASKGAAKASSYLLVLAILLTLGVL